MSLSSGVKTTIKTCRTSLLDFSLCYVSIIRSKNQIAVVFIEPRNLPGWRASSSGSSRYSSLRKNAKESSLTYILRTRHPSTGYFGHLSCFVKNNSSGPAKRGHQSRKIYHDRIRAEVASNKRTISNNIRSVAWRVNTHPKQNDCSRPQDTKALR